MNVVVQRRSLALLLLLLSGSVGMQLGCSTLDDASSEFAFTEQKHGAEDSEDEDSEDEDRPDPDEETTEEPKPEPEPEPEPEDPEPEEPEPEERDCAKIAWGKMLREGDIVVRGETVGYLDSDGDDKIEKKLASIGMCQLHRTGKKCGLVYYASASSPICPGELQTLSGMLDRVKAADMALYMHFMETDLDSGYTALLSETYLNSSYFHMLSNKDSLELAVSPRKALIDLRTMKVVALDLPLIRAYTIEDMVKACEAL